MTTNEEIMAVEPVSVSSSPKKPEIEVYYVAPGHNIMSPEQVEASQVKVPKNEIGPATWKASETMALRCSSCVSIVEAKTLKFLAQKKISRVPKLLAAYTFGPLNRKIEDHGSLYDTYIFTEFIEGETLETMWPSYDNETKTRIAEQLKEFWDTLRSIPRADYIGSVFRGPLLDHMFKRNAPSRGPFDSEETFNAAITATYQATRGGHSSALVAELLRSHKHQIVFSHGNCRPNNIVVKDGHVEAIVNWGLAGWYPEYWDFAKAFEGRTFRTDWEIYLPTILKPYYYTAMKLIEQIQFPHVRAPYLLYSKEQSQRIKAQDKKKSIR
ncbi:MAG: hypothetical protein M1837_005911 [Sclerophora amabilis]|nr:MAG: hypothetical protein M1837_005911 [Sclerophora amabilis]